MVVGGSQQETLDPGFRATWHSSAPSDQLIVRHLNLQSLISLLCIKITSLSRFNNEYEPILQTYITGDGGNL
ncbi:unnamed protein product [Schistosoma margrebowiei]|uniref:Uncharacterized protein n=1 Tax=Schistosoma margrebowiei TaxID=48269 RepID=A0A183LU36_9TREM|nr:unnamed protein product [Schistosoma margrebowiei]